MVGFTDVFMRHTSAKRVLIIVPINTLQNWINEFDMWLPSAENVQVILLTHPNDQYNVSTVGFVLDMLLNVTFTYWL